MGYLQTPWPFPGGDSTARCSAKTSMKAAKSSLQVSKGPKAEVRKQSKPSLTGSTFTSDGLCFSGERTRLRFMSSWFLPAT